MQDDGDVMYARGQWWKKNEKKRAGEFFKSIQYEIVHSYILSAFCTQKMTTVIKVMNTKFREEGFMN